MSARIARLSFLSVGLAAGIVFGCACGKSEETKPAPVTKETDWTGSVSEEQFKAMHQLKTGEVPRLEGQMVELAGGQAYLSLPPNAEPPLAGVVVIQEWWGLNDNIKYWTDRIAAEGYAALAVDLYDGKVATTPDSAMSYVKSTDPARALEILLAGHRFLAEDGRIRAERRGSIGWCFGGQRSLRLALAAPDLSACVVYYGSPVVDVDQLRSIGAPLLCVFGNKDEAIPPAKVDAFDAALPRPA